MRRVILGLVVLLVLAPACGDDVNPGGPSGPSSPTVTSVTITGTLAIGNLGLTTKLIATAHFAKGTTQDVTSLATWASGDLTIATVTQGMVTAVSVGAATITATYQNVSGSTRVTVTKPPTYTLSGVVTESVPTTSTLLSGVRVELMDGANLGKFGVTDSSGKYQITGAETGTLFNVRATLTGYTDQTKQVAISGNTALDFALVPTVKQLRETIVRNISGGDAACYQGYACQVVDIPLHNTGVFDGVLTWGSTADAFLVLQLFSVDTNRVLAESSATDAARQAVSANMSAPGNYQLRVVAMRIATITPFSLVTNHPN